MDTLSSDESASSPSDCVSAKTLPFSKVCDLLDHVDRLTSSTGKANVRENSQVAFDKLFGFWRRLANEARDPADNAFHLLRLLVPHLDRERPPYNLKEQKLAKFLIDLLSISKTSDDAVRLLNYKAPLAAAAAAKSDFASTVFFVLKKRAACRDSSEMSVSDVNVQLDAFAKSQQEGAKGKSEASREFHVFLQKLSARDVKWLLRMILKDLKIKMGQRSILNCFHPDADDFFNSNSSLRKLASTLSDPKKRLCEIEIEIFTPFRPMLAEKCESPTEVEKKMENEEFFLETKLDGERIQLHRDGDKYKYFTRNNFDLSAQFGATSVSGSLTRHIHSSFKSGLSSVILDGEMIGFDASSTSRVSKAANCDVKSLSGDGVDGPQPCFFVFDVLYLNGRVLTGLPLRERISILTNDVFVPTEGRLMHVHRLTGRRNQTALSFFNDAIDAREEGVIVKSSSSLYRANSRKGGWLKLKPEYVDSLTETLDLVIVGGYFGAGNRGTVSTLTHFLLALGHKVAESDSVPSQFHTVCRVGSGYTFLELQELNNKLRQSLVRNTDERSRPSNVLTSMKGKGKKPDVWIRPEKSVVVEVKAAELTESEAFKVSHTLRFPRIVNFRSDKSFTDCSTTADFESLLRSNAGKLTAVGGLSTTMSADATASPAKRRKLDGIANSRSPAKRRLAPNFEAPDLDEVVESSKAFGGNEFVILNDPPDLASSMSPLKKMVSTDTDSEPRKMFSRRELQIKVKELGGTISQNPTPTTFCIVSFKDDLRTKNFSRTGKYLVVRGDWLLRCIAARKLLPLAPLDCLVATEEVRLSFRGRFDKFGDSYENPVDEQMLREIFDAVDVSGFVGSIEGWKEELVGQSPFHVFIGKVFYVDLLERLSDSSSRDLDSSLEVVSLDLIRFGGEVVENLDDSRLTHVVCVRSDRAETYRSIRREKSKKFHIVNPDWVAESVRKGRLETERLYELF